ncbi:zinc-binding dehydrogenase [Enterococcus sp. CSURQ0835]|uniref:zinc-binding dehydrogenase n=1 Tax=Enterococcus sp. CSURQ0835 TaxID=2681394 RepID=UPI001357BEAF|nr:zinc-binding dehydrogenase [Enterococcus sp. CSURQ0835]
MQAVVLETFGSSAGFNLVERPIPRARPGWSVIKNQAFGLNRAELYTRLGQSPDVSLPRVLGIEAVGEIEETVDGKLPVGTKVMTLMGGLGRQFDGSYEEYLAVPNDQIYPLTVTDTWEQLATIPESGYTAYGSLKVANIKAGQKVLVRGGTSTVGLATLSFLRFLETEVTATSRQIKRASDLLDLGADYFVLEKAGKLQTEVTYDAIIDFVGVKTLRDSLQHLKPGGVHVVTGGLANTWELPNFSPFEIPSGAYLSNFQSTVVDVNLLSELQTFITQHQLRFKIGAVFSLSDMKHAQDVLQAGDVLGKLVVRV